LRNYTTSFATNLSIGWSFVVLLNVVFDILSHLVNSIRVSTICDVQKSCLIPHLRHWISLATLKLVIVNLLYLIEVSFDPEFKISIS